MIDNLINKSSDIDKQSLGAMYILGSLTLVSKNAADYCLYCTNPFLIYNIFYN